MKNLTVANKADLQDNNGVYFIGELSNSEVIEIMQECAVGVYGDDEEGDLYVFSDGSCINRQGDEYYLNDDADTLDQDYLDSVGY